MKKICPRCGAAFECMHDKDMTLCHCTRIVLSESQRSQIKSLYSECLCHSCLLFFSEQ